MTCLTCFHWRRDVSVPERGPAARRRRAAAQGSGTCALDSEPAHSNYTCKKFKRKGDMDVPVAAWFGLTRREAAWLKANNQPGNTAHELVSAFRKAWEQPEDDHLRSMFDLKLRVWRDRRAEYAKQKLDNPETALMPPPVDAI